MTAATARSLVRNDDRIIIHSDVDSFYAQVFEVANPALRGLPLAVQQKQIIVTCNYEARRRGLHKLQLISEAKRVCPDVIIVLGEQLDRFRDASKALYKYLESFTWNKRVERLGFDEVFLDVTDIITYNQELLNFNDLSHAFFQLSRDDPTNGFPFDATKISGHQYPEVSAQLPVLEIMKSNLMKRLMLGSHLAQHIRYKLEQERGYTATFGISTSKLLSKLVGNIHKPRNQTTLMPSYESLSAGELAQESQDHVSAPYESYVSTVTKFIDSHDIGKIPGIGFKMSQKIRSHILSRPAQFDEGLIWGGTKEAISVSDVRQYPGMGPQLLEKLLGGPGTERGIAYKIWGLINGIDDSEVRKLKKIPSQISIEDSYIHLDTMAQVYKELRILSTTLLERMRVDLLEDDDYGDNVQNVSAPPTVESSLVSSEFSALNKRWIAHPKTLRLTTRPRPSLKPDGTRSRTFNRISKSGPLPNLVFNLHEGIDILVEKLVQEALIPMFHRLHQQSWNLSLINVAVSNMVETASDDGSGGGRDIGRMFQRQEKVLEDWKVEDKDVPPDLTDEKKVEDKGVPPDLTDEKKVDGALDYELCPKIQADPRASDEAIQSSAVEVTYFTQDGPDEDTEWQDGGSESSNRCHTCGAGIPEFAMAAHLLYHTLGD